MEIVHRFGHIFESAGFWEWLAVVTALTAGSIAAVAAVVVSWPADRFASASVQQTQAPLPRHRVARVVLRNLVGGLLVVLGAVMALPGVPGQGLLTILIGLSLVDFPGKIRFERAIVSRRHVRRALDRLRARFDRPPLRFDDPEPPPPRS